MSTQKPKFFRLDYVHNKVLTIKTEEYMYSFLMGDEEYLAIYSIWIDDVEWFRKNAELISTEVCRIEIGVHYKPSILSIDAFKTRQKLEYPIYFEPGEMMQVALHETGFVGGLPTTHLYGISSHGKIA